MRRPSRFAVYAAVLTAVTAVTSCANTRSDWRTASREPVGPGVEQLIERIDKAARSYPYGAEYRAWPGPNSNTFTAWIARAVPELEVDLPATAIGKDYLGSSIFGSAPSGSGFQLSLVGVLGLAVSPVDGLEFNVLGLNFGVSPSGVKLPMVGRVGGSEHPSDRAAEAQPKRPVSGEDI